jgi:hypothetical protein
MAILIWRLVLALTSSWKWSLFVCLFALLAVNVANNVFDDISDIMQMLGLVVAFVCGVWLLMQAKQPAQSAVPTT